MEDLQIEWQWDFTLFLRYFTLPDEGPAESSFIKDFNFLFSSSNASLSFLSWLAS